MSAVSLSGDRAHFALVHETLEEPPEIHVTRADEFQPKRISSVHDTVPKPAMGKTEILQWKSKDGLEIEGLLTYPVGYSAGESVPLVLVVHGGPAGKFGQNFTGLPGIYPVQVFAQAGYALLRPNPRGSMGYGKDFRYANVRDWGLGRL